jgi:hypothetical protein
MWRKLTHPSRRDIDKKWKEESEHAKSDENEEERNGMETRGERETSSDEMEKFEDKEEIIDNGSI